MVWIAITAEEGLYKISQFKLSGELQLIGHKISFWIESISEENITINKCVIFFIRELVVCLFRLIRKGIALFNGFSLDVYGICSNFNLSKLGENEISTAVYIQNETFKNYISKLSTLNIIKVRDICLGN